MRKILSFIKHVIGHVIKNIINFVKDLVNNIESVIILTFSVIGISAVLSEIPFMYTVPLWIDATMIIPLISILTIMLLIKCIKLRGLVTCDTCPTL